MQWVTLHRLTFVREMWFVDCSCRRAQETGRGPTEVAIYVTLKAEEGVNCQNVHVM